MAVPVHQIDQLFTRKAYREHMTSLRNEIKKLELTSGKAPAACHGDE